MPEGFKIIWYTNKGRRDVTLLHNKETNEHRIIAQADDISHEITDLRDYSHARRVYVSMVVTFIMGKTGIGHDKVRLIA